MKYLNLKITKYIHDGFRLDWPGDQSFSLDELKNGKYEQTIYIDPFKIPDDQPKADIIFISHEHYDHCDKESIEKLLKAETVVVGNEKVQKALESLKIKNFEVASAGSQKGINGLTFLGIHAYNINKFREPGVPFHPKENGGLGYLLHFNIHSESEGIYVYFMGDTDFNEELMKPAKVDVLLIPISGTYVMTVEEAVDAMKAINPKLAIPMHYDSGFVGSMEDAQKFKKEFGEKVQILQIEGANHE